jgi:predicted Holliday junction resolvase-like endonuclease
MTSVELILHKSLENVKRNIELSSQSIDSLKRQLESNEHDLKNALQVKAEIEQALTDLGAKNEKNTESKEATPQRKSTKKR